MVASKILLGMLRICSGLHLLLSIESPFLKTACIRDVFPKEGILECTRLNLNNGWRLLMMDSLHSWRSLGEMRSGPVAFLGLIVDISLISIG